MADRQNRREPSTTERRFCCVLLSVGNRTDSQGPTLLVSPSPDPHFKVEDGYRTSRGPNAYVRERALYVRIVEYPRAIAGVSQ